jgi:folate-dependent tRNA-U54 methylase TrmFO/GidA
MNANYGIIAPLNIKVKGKNLRRQEYSKRAIEATNEILKEIER